MTYFFANLKWGLCSYIRGAHLLVTRLLHLIFVNSWHGTCFMPPFWHVEVWGSSWVVWKFVHLWLIVCHYVLHKECVQMQQKWIMWWIELCPQPVYLIFVTQPHTLLQPELWLSKAKVLIQTSDLRMVVGVISGYEMNPTAEFWFCDWHDVPGEWFEYGSPVWKQL